MTDMSFEFCGHCCKPTVHYIDKTAGGMFREKTCSVCGYLSSRTMIFTLPDKEGASE
jgi:hypothetical protein